MTQHVTFTYDSTTQTGVADPEVANVWRDDQVLMFGLGPNAAWGASPPIVFNRDGGPGIAPWPGTDPEPIGPPPLTGQPDTRYYVAMAMKVMVTGTEKYTYMATVVPIGGGGDPVAVKKMGTEFDPEVENQSQP